MRERQHAYPKGSVSHDELRVMEANSDEGRLLVVVWTDYRQSARGRGGRGAGEMYLKSMLMLKYIRVSTSGGAHLDSGRPLITECTVKPTCTVYINVRYFSASRISYPFYE